MQTLFGHCLILQQPKTNTTRSVLVFIKDNLWQHTRELFSHVLLPLAPILSCLIMYTVLVMACRSFYTHSFVVMSYWAHMSLNAIIQLLLLQNGLKQPSWAKPTWAAALGGGVRNQDHPCLNILLPLLPDCTFPPTGSDRFGGLKTCSGCQEPGAWGQEPGGPEPGARSWLVWLRSQTSACQADTSAGMSWSGGDILFLQKWLSPVI